MEKLRESHTQPVHVVLVITQLVVRLTLKGGGRGG